MNYFNTAPRPPHQNSVTAIFRIGLQKQASALPQMEMPFSVTTHAREWTHTSVADLKQ
jgi:hypothetical protein